MENADVFGSSTAPLTWHDFLERMRQPSATEFVKSIKSFIVSFSNNAPDPEKDSAAVQEFLANMEMAFRAHSLWAGCSEEELESAGEGLEKYVMTKLYTRVFASLPEDVKHDEQLSEKMALIQQFIHPENLDIKSTFQNEASWLANPPQLHSNLLYIQRYRRQSRLVSEAAYFFTNMLSAESFIYNIDAKSLSMDETEFEENMKFAQTLLSGLSTDLGVPDQSNQDLEHVQRKEPVDPKLQPLDSKKERYNAPPAIQRHLPHQSSEIKSANKEDLHAKDQSSMTKRPSIPDLEKEGATELLKEDHLSRLFQEYRYLYAQVGDLTINDVEDLLNSYKQLVFKYVSLRKGLDGTTPMPIPRSQLQTQINAEKESEEKIETVMSNDKHEDTGRTDDIIDQSTLVEQMIL
uniref:Vacuolar protein sorting-associated protein 9A-like n=1 Tax=Nelumbo nucifera TaxID=4432 RepID=A0A822XVR1_NELNU|nr:TPA_asm: hypothetical protein HUJ06_025881 [Nelumbo nucifera]